MQWKANSLFSEIQPSVARKKKPVCPNEDKTGKKEKSWTDPEISVMQALKKWSMFSIITIKFSERFNQQRQLNKANSVLNSELKREWCRKTGDVWLWARKPFIVQQCLWEIISTSVGHKLIQFWKRKPYGCIPLALHHKCAQSNSRKELGFSSFVFFLCCKSYSVPSYIKLFSMELFRYILI